jgi:hypothetical protein
MFSRKRRLIAILFFLHFSAILVSSNSFSQVIARITVDVSASSFATPVRLSLDEISSDPDSVLDLVELAGNTRVKTPFQVEHNFGRTIWWLLPATNNATKKQRIFELSKKANAGTSPSSITVSTASGALVIANGNKNILQYNFNTWYPPSGVDTVFKKSGFIHPVWTPSGHVLTRVNPPDHYHHYGIWNPWTKVKFKGKTVDFWNLKAKQGTVRFADFIDTEEGQVYGGFKALQKHVIFGENGSEQYPLNEVLEVKAYNPGNNVWLWDFVSTLNCATKDSVILMEYRYGGYGFRATEEWTNKNSRILTSEGKTRKQADSAVARWGLVEGDLKDDHGGIVFMSHPANYNFPEPTRVWPEDANNNRGDVFFSFSPTRDKNWVLQPGKKYVLRYRMLVYDGTLSAAQAEQAWKGFAIPPKMTVKLLK